MIEYIMEHTIMLFQTYLNMEVRSKISDNILGEGEVIKIK
jgi:hypothetical protein